jgi:hypothetical protein
LNPDTSKAKMLYLMQVMSRRGDGARDTSKRKKENEPQWVRNAVGESKKRFGDAGVLPFEYRMRPSAVRSP